MDKYDYASEVRWSIMDWLTDECTAADLIAAAKDTNKYNDLVEQCQNADRVTGNQSGSYTCDRYEAEENLCHNGYMWREVVCDLGVNAALFFSDPEAADVTIRFWIVEHEFDKAFEMVYADLIDD